MQQSKPKRLHKNALKLLWRRKKYVNCILCHFFWEIIKTQHNKMKNHNENCMFVPFSVFYWNIMYLFLVFLQNVIENKIVKDKHIFTATSRWYKPVIDYISHTLQPTSKLIYCHLSDTSAQLPHFICKDRRRLLHMSWNHMCSWTVQYNYPSTHYQYSSHYEWY